MCFEGYYDDGSSATCVQCSPTCLTCDAATTCLSCTAGVRELMASVCNCISGYSFGSECLACDITCLSCNGSGSGDCLTCQADRVLSAGQCLCTLNTFGNVGEAFCAPCLYFCLTCLNAFSCSSCEGVIDRRVIDSQLACLCELGYYDDSVNAACVSCNSVPYFCDSCVLSACLTCRVADNRVLRNRFCVCVSNYYLLGTNCIPCAPSCLTCSSFTASSCLSCRLGLSFAGGRCQCQPGQTLLTSSCVDCAPSCLTCSGPEVDDCLTCDPDENRLPISADSTCLCRPRFYDLGLPVCRECSVFCALCEGGASLCLSCPAMSSRVISSGACVCLTGYYSPPFRTACQLCSHACLTCDSQFFCLSCAGSTRRISEDGLCGCQPMLFDEGAADCSSCHFTCAACSGALPTSCTECGESGRSLVQESCYCLPGLFE